MITRAIKNKLILENIYESILRIEKYSKGLTKMKFLKDIATQDAIILRLEIIGVMIKKLPLDLKKKNIGIKWRKFAGMSDKLIQKYYEVDLDLIWETIKKDLPEFKKQIKKMMAKF